MKKLSAAAFCAALALTACKKEVAAPSAPKEAAPKVAEAQKAPAVAAPSWVTLDKMGVKIQMPAGAKADDTSADAPNYSVAPEDYSYTVMVSTVTEAYPDQYEKAVEEVKKMTNGFKSFTRNEKTADGWVLEFEGESMMDKAPLYGVVVRKKIGAKAVECARNESSKAARDNVSKACFTIAAL